MLKGHVFKKQIFGNQIFALFINTFLNGHNGISSDYKNSMALNYSGSTVTIDSGAVCIQGRFLEEDTSSSITAGTDTAFCRLVIEIDLDKENTQDAFVQGQYKIVKGTSNYPNLTQNEIVKSNSGIYQYELAQFKTSSIGISDFVDKRTFLDFESIYSIMEAEYREVLKQLKEELANVEDGSAYLLKNDYAVIEGSFNSTAKTGNENVFNSFDLDFPPGFNKDNCVCIALGINMNPNDSGYGYDLTNPADARSWNRNALYRNVVIGKPSDLSKIFLTVETPFTDIRIIKFKIVLMRINRNVNTYKQGNVNGDGVVDENDLNMIQDYIMGKVALTDTQFQAADMNGDGQVKSADYIALKNQLGL